MIGYFTITVRPTVAAVHEELSIYIDRDFKRTMQKFIALDDEVTPDSILSFYWKDGKRFRQWFAGRSINRASC